MADEPPHSRLGAPHYAAFKYLLFLGGGFALLYLAFRNQPLQQIGVALQEANYFWAAAVLGISTISHLIRAMRWKRMIAGAGYEVSTANAFASLMAGYLVNIGIPRLGELSRCAALSKTNKVPFSPVLGTVITERITDIACLGGVVVLAFLLQTEQLFNFYQQEISPSLSDALSKKSLAFRALGIISVLSATLAFAYLLLQWKELKRKRWFLAGIRQLKHIWMGISSIFRQQNPWPFLAYTAAIWVCYYFMTYIWFFCFEETKHLSIAAGLAMMAVGSIARSLPIQGGGMGAYHYLFAQALLLYGVDAIHGAALAILVHGAQMIYTILVGGLSLVWLGMKNRQ